MRRFLVCSDIHTYIENVPLALAQTPDAGAVIISGDLEVDMDAVRGACGGLPVYLVSGNHDPYLEGKVPRELLMDIDPDGAVSSRPVRPRRRPLFRRRRPAQGAHRILLTHGNLYGVPALDTLTTRAVAFGADIVIFGHTHQWLFTQEEGAGGRRVRFLNPGSMMGEAGRLREIGCGSFAVMTVDGETVRAEHYLL